jgi:nucleoside-diphosphate-sugar epimerase
MTRVLIAGADSYIGGRLAAWLARRPEAFQTDTLDLRGDGWRIFDFSGFDAAVLVAGLAHRRETPADAPLYDAVNRVLAVKVADAARAAGVRQFVFFSSMSVYGLSAGRIGADTKPAPDTAYGRSKLAAENELAALANDRFRVAILRPPMVYGGGCRGNYPRLSALIRKTPVFPKVGNERSMLYIDTLCAFLEALLADGRGGLFFPQNRAYVDTGELARLIAQARGKRLWQPGGLKRLLAGLSGRGGALGKLFGTLTYDQAMSAAFRPEREPSFAETIRITEAGE